MHRHRTRRPSVNARGEPQLWITGGSLVICITMIVGLVGWILVNGLPTFWPERVERVKTLGGIELMGEPNRSSSFEPDPSVLAALTPESRKAADVWLAAHDGELDRVMLRTGNFELTDTRFTEYFSHEVVERDQPEWAVVVERLAWGRFYGLPTAFLMTTPVFPDRSPGEASVQETQTEGRRLLGELDPPQPGEGVDLAFVVQRDEGGKRRMRLVAQDALAAGERVLSVARVWRGAEVAWKRYEEARAGVDALIERADRKRRHEIGEANEHLGAARLRLRQAILDHHPAQVWESAFEELQQTERSGDESATVRARQRLAAIEADFGSPDAELQKVIAEVGRVEREQDEQIRRLTAEMHEIDREAHRPMLWFDTVDSARDTGIALAEIVRAYPANQLGTAARFGVFLDRWREFLTERPRNANEEGGIFPAIFGTVLMTLIMCLVVVPFGVLAALYLREYAKAGFVISLVRIAVNNLAGVPSIVFGVFGLGFFCYIVGGSIDRVFFAASLPQPTFGKGGLLWAALTLALMTAPVVIVATEEALAAVPNSMREGSYACGASKWQTIRRIVLPRAMPGIMTGAILAMARGAGEVAPLMLVGAVKLAADLPFDLSPPFGLDRSFMHMGYHVFDLGFQSPDSVAAKPMVYTTTLLLILTIASLNLAAIWLRSRLRRRFVSAAF
ncbi:MAG: phosphate ABC transporter permease PstA [Planctomycetota bacterium]